MSLTDTLTSFPTYEESSSNISTVGFQASAGMVSIVSSLMVWRKGGGGGGGREERERERERERKR